MNKPLFAPTGILPPSPALTAAFTSSGQQGPFVNACKRASGLPSNPAVVPVQMASAFRGLFDPYRYKILFGGRGGAKSWAVGQALAMLGAKSPLRILCAREFQTSIKDSVIALLKSQIQRLGLKSKYKFGTTYIEGKNGTEFLFKGLRINPDEIKSLEGVDICWVEEAQRVSEDSWTYLIPTIRKEGSEIWATLNPVDEDDATYSRFILNTPPDTLLINVNWCDNPWFPDTLNKERLYCFEVDRDAYEWIWEGKPRKISNAIIFKGKFVVERFETPKDTRLRQGADWGFGPDPTVLTRWWEKDDDLYVDYESYHHELDLNDIAETWLADIPRCDKVKTWADHDLATIKHVRGYGFRIVKAKKGAGSIEEGVRHMRSYRQIHVHERCTHTEQEFRLYSYKVHPITGEPTREIKDANNHCMDTGRYALSTVIQRKKYRKDKRRRHRSDDDE